jgi:hypothetical protein
MTSSDFSVSIILIPMTVPLICGLEGCHEVTTGRLVLLQLHLPGGEDGVLDVPICENHQLEISENYVVSWPLFEDLSSSHVMAHLTRLLALHKILIDHLALPYRFKAEWITLVANSLHLFVRARLGTLISFHLKSLKTLLVG